MEGNEKITVYAIDRRMVMLESDIKHIRERIDNGMSKTITSLDNKFDALSLKIAEEIMPVVKDSQYWIGWLKKGVAGTFVSGLVFSVGYLMWYYIKKCLGIPT